MSYDVHRACADSLQRSRSRRRMAALRLTVVRRRRRRRSGSTTAAAIVAMFALGGPLAFGQTTAQAPAPKILKAGSSGSSVSQLQAALGIRQTGRFTAATRRAVIRFQRRNGLAVDGIVGPQTAGALGLSFGTGGGAREAVAGSGSGTLARIAACESGGDPTAVSADGRYRGKYQFTRATWRAMGGSGDPAAAPEAEQDRRAAALLAQQGTAPWPACG